MRTLWAFLKRDAAIEASYRILRMHIVLLNYMYDAEYPTVDALLDRYLSLTGWAESLLAAEAGRVTVLQRYKCDIDFRRGGVEYRLRGGADCGARGLSDPRRLHRLVAELRPDVAHVNGLIFPLQIWLLRRVLPRHAALIVQDHGGPPPVARSVGARLRHVVKRAGLRVVDAFMFTSALQAQPWRAAGLIGLNQPVYEVVEAGRPLRPLPREQARAASGIRGDPAVLWVGHLDANKDPLTVLDGFERALLHLPGARLTMVYVNDTLLPAVRARLAASPALNERVDLRGHVPYDVIAAYFSAADIFVLGSHREGSGYALIEALSCGLIPVVTDIPSFRALTTDGDGAHFGALWPPGNAHACASALIEIGRRDMAALREQLIAYGVRKLSWEAIGRQALAVYRDVLARRRGYDD
jgi:glycosyltransferase involved in cell wall biosynthesis